MLSHTHREGLANSYLHHILIALVAGDRGAPFRTFLDNWYAYHVGNDHLTAGGRPVWFNNPCARRHQRALLAMHFLSKDAAKILEQATRDSTAYLLARRRRQAEIRLMVDHSIPLMRLREAMFADKELRTIDAIRDFLLSNFRLGVLTADEDSQLNTLGLNNAMPEDWDGSDPFARYFKAGIDRYQPSAA